MRFYNTRSDCQWIADTALKGITLPKFNSFVIAGNEDCPVSIRLYRDANPRFDAAPLAVYRITDSLTYTRQERIN